MDKKEWMSLQAFSLKYKVSPDTIRRILRHHFKEDEDYIQYRTQSAAMTKFIKINPKITGHDIIKYKKGARWRKLR